MMFHVKRSRASCLPTRAAMFGACLAMLAADRGQSFAEDGVHRYGVVGQAFVPAVAVTNRELVHTAQLLPVDPNGKLVGPGDPRMQVQRVLEALDEVLEAQQASPADIVKMNVYVADDATNSALVDAVHRRFFRSGMAYSLVTTRLPVDGALVAIDAVIARQRTIADGRPARRREAAIGGREKLAHSAVLPVGETIYVSGQAEPGEDLARATAATLGGLKRTLDHLGLGLEHVVQIKCFLLPMSDVDHAYDEIEKFFGDELAPPTSVVEWISSLPIEIEMIAHSPVDTPGTGVTHEWLPWLTSSPVYCRLARVHGPTQIYFSHCSGESGADDATQVQGAFDGLRFHLNMVGSDLRHLAKATYYVTNEAASAAVNEIRPKLYDPEHPPAASKALVVPILETRRTFSFDIIAVPADE